MIAVGLATKCIALLVALSSTLGMAADGMPSRSMPSENPHRVDYRGSKGPGDGKRIVLLAGDHEYRSEEILPALARILAKRFGFECNVFFTLDEAGFVQPGSSRIQGLEILREADLVIMGLRFQDFPDDEMQHIVDYLDRGAPIVGLRTSTHAFNIADGPHKKYTYNYAGDEYVGGFGRQVLGETWAGHYGTNHKQSSRVLAEASQSDHPILRGVTDMHVMCGGYKAYPLDGSVVLARGQVLNGMLPDSPVDTEKELLPVVWTRTYTGAKGNEGRVFTTTHGASQDFVNEGFRRLLVNGTFWALGMEDAIMANSDVSFVGPYNPVDFSFGGYRREVRPSDLEGWDTPIFDASKATQE
ncbi:MAG: type 1 glutamine amidotransferase [Planctomycetota bacterium]|jgi:type 1 glutamine amidotransferase